jgi:hypothetical protein
MHTIGVIVFDVMIGRQGQTEHLIRRPLHRTADRAGLRIIDVRTRHYILAVAVAVAGSECQAGGNAIAERSR